MAAVERVEAAGGGGGRELVGPVWAVWAVSTAGSLLYRASAAWLDAAAASSTWDVSERTT